MSFVDVDECGSNAYLGQLLMSIFIVGEQCSSAIYDLRIR